MAYSPAQSTKISALGQTNRVPIRRYIQWQVYAVNIRGDPFASFAKRMMRPYLSNCVWGALADSTGSVSRTSAPCGAGRGSRGSAASGRTRTRTATSHAKLSNCARCRNIFHSTAGTSSAGRRRNRTARRSSGMRKQSSARVALPFPRWDRTRGAGITSTALLCKARAANFFRLVQAFVNSLFALWNSRERSQRKSIAPRFSAAKNVENESGSRALMRFWPTQRPPFMARRLSQRFEWIGLTNAFGPRAAPLQCLPNTHTMFAGFFCVRRPATLKPSSSPQSSCNK